MHNPTAVDDVTTMAIEVIRGTLRDRLLELNIAEPVATDIAERFADSVQWDWTFVIELALSVKGGK